MSIAPIGSSGPPLPQPTLGDPAAAALAGLQQAQAQVEAATEQVAAGNTDPAVIVDVANAETAFAVNAKVMQTGVAMTRKLLDMLA